MDLLLDVHTLIWFFNGDKKLSKKAKSLIEDTGNRKFFSIASLWEISIKIGLRKLKFDGGLSEIASLVNQNGFEILPISIEHLDKYGSLEFIHNDPFDRIIIAQAITDILTIVTIDDNIKKYKVKIQW